MAGYIPTLRGLLVLALSASQYLNTSSTDAGNQDISIKSGPKELVSFLLPTDVIPQVEPVFQIIIEPTRAVPAQIVTPLPVVDELIIESRYEPSYRQKIITAILLLACLWLTVLYTDILLRYDSIIAFRDLAQQGHITAPDLVAFEARCAVHGRPVPEDWPNFLLTPAYALRGHLAFIATIMPHATVMVLIAIFVQYIWAFDQFKSDTILTAFYASRTYVVAVDRYAWLTTIKVYEWALNLIKTLEAEEFVLTPAIIMVLFILGIVIFFLLLLCGCCCDDSDPSLPSPPPPPAPFGPLGPPSKDNEEHLRIPLPPSPAPTPSLAPVRAPAPSHLTTSSPTIPILGSAQEEAREELQRRLYSVRRYLTFSRPILIASPAVPELVPGPASVKSCESTKSEDYFSPVEAYSSPITLAENNTGSGRSLDTAPEPSSLAESTKSSDNSGEIFWLRGGDCVKIRDPVKVALPRLLTEAEKAERRQKELELYLAESKREHSLKQAERNLVRQSQQSSESIEGHHAVVGSPIVPIELAEDRQSTDLPVPDVLRTPGLSFAEKYPDGSRTPAGPSTAPTAAEQTLPEPRKARPSLALTIPENSRVLPPRFLGLLSPSTPSTGSLPRDVPAPPLSEQRSFSPDSPSDRRNPYLPDSLSSSLATSQIPEASAIRIAQPMSRNSTPPLPDSRSESSFKSSPVTPVLPSSNLSNIAGRVHDKSMNAPQVDGDHLDRFLASIAEGEEADHQFEQSSASSCTSSQSPSPQPSDSPPPSSGEPPPNPSASPSLSHRSPSPIAIESIEGVLEHYDEAEINMSDAAPQGQDDNGDASMSEDEQDEDLPMAQPMEVVEDDEMADEPVAPINVNHMDPMEDLMTGSIPPVNNAFRFVPATTSSVQLLNSFQFQAPLATSSTRLHNPFQDRMPAPAFSLATPAPFRSSVPIPTSIVRHAPEASMTEPSRQPAGLPQPAPGPSSFAMGGMITPEQLQSLIRRLDQPSESTTKQQVASTASSRNDTGTRDIAMPSAPPVSVVPEPFVGFDALFEAGRPREAAPMIPNPNGLTKSIGTQPADFNPFASSIIAFDPSASVRAPENAFTHAMQISRNAQPFTSGTVFQPSSMLIPCRPVSIQASTQPTLLPFPPALTSIPEETAAIRSAATSDATTRQQTWRRPEQSRTVGPSLSFGPITKSIKNEPVRIPSQPTANALNPETDMLIEGIHGVNYEGEAGDDARNNAWDEQAEAESVKREHQIFQQAAEESRISKAEEEARVLAYAAAQSDSKESSSSSEETDDEHESIVAEGDDDEDRCIEDQEPRAVGTYAAERALPQRTPSQIYRSHFPTGHRLILTSGIGADCGFRSVVLSIQAQAAFTALTVPTVDDLRDIYQGQVIPWMRHQGFPVPGHNADISPEILARVYTIWGQRYGDAVILGLYAEGNEPVLLELEDFPFYTDDYPLFIWIYNNNLTVRGLGSRDHYAGMDRNRGTSHQRSPFAATPSPDPEPANEAIAARRAAEALALCSGAGGISWAINGSPGQLVQPAPPAPRSLDELRILGAAGRGASLKAKKPNVLKFPAVKASGSAVPKAGVAKPAPASTPLAPIASPAPESASGHTPFIVHEEPQDTVHDDGFETQAAAASGSPDMMIEVNIEGQPHETSAPEPEAAENIDMVIFEDKENEEQPNPKKRSRDETEESRMPLSELYRQAKQPRLDESPVQQQDLDLENVQGTTGVEAITGPLSLAYTGGLVTNNDEASDAAAVPLPGGFDDLSDYESIDGITPPALDETRPMSPTKITALKMAAQALDEEDRLSKDPPAPKRQLLRPTQALDSYEAGDGFNFALRERYDEAGWYVDAANETDRAQRDLQRAAEASESRRALMTGEQHAGEMRWLEDAMGSTNLGKRRRDGPVKSSSAETEKQDENGQGDADMAEGQE